MFLKVAILALAAQTAVAISFGKKTVSKAAPLKVQGFIIPPDAKSVDDVIGPNGSAGTKLKIASELRKMGRPLPLTYKAPLTDEEREAKLKLKGQVGTAGLVVTTFLMLNILETFLNAQFNLFPQFKREWNYSGNNDALCRELEAKGEYSKVCDSWNLDYLTNKAAKASK